MLPATSCSSGTNGASLQGGGTFTGNLVIGGPTQVNFDNGGVLGAYGGTGQIQVPFSGNVTSGAAVRASNAWAVISDSNIGATTLTGSTVVSAGTISNNIVLNSASQPFTKSDVTKTFAFSTQPFLVGFGGAAGGTLVIKGNISGNSDVVLGSNAVNGAGGSGTVLLSGGNNYAGTTIIDGAGVVQLGSAAALPSTTDVIFGVTDATTTTLNLNGFNQTINSLSSASGKPVITSTSNVALTISGATTPINAYGGTITGKVSLTKNGAGGLGLSGKNTYSGATAINQGTLTVSGTEPLGTGALTVANGAGIVYSGAAVTFANATASFAVGSSLSPAGTAAYGTLTVTNTMNLNGGNLTYDFNTTQSDLISGGTLNLGERKFCEPDRHQSQHHRPDVQFVPVVHLQDPAELQRERLHDGLRHYGRLHLWFHLERRHGQPDDYRHRQQQPADPAKLVLGDRQRQLGLDDDELGRHQDLRRRRWRTFPEPTAGNSIVTINSAGVTPLSLTISNTSNSYTFTGGPIMGTTGLTKNGSGLATLASTNSYAGGTTVNAGTLATGAAGDAALGAGSGGITLVAGTLQFTTSNYASTRAIAVTNGTIVASSGAATMTGNLTLGSGTLNTAGPGTLAFTGGAATAVSVGASSTLNVNSGTLAVIPENLTDSGALNVATGATLLFQTSTPPSSNSKTVTLGGPTAVNGNLVVTNPITLATNGTAISGSGAIQFQNMYTYPAPTHFTVADAQCFQVSNGGTAVTQNVNCNIQLNSTNQPYYATSLSQSGGNTSGNGFILGNGVTCSFFLIDPGTGNTLNINGVISGSCDVQFGAVGGGGQKNWINLNSQNTYTGVTMFESGFGNITLGASNAFPTTTALVFAPVNGNSYQTTVDLNGNNQTVASLSYWANANNDGTSGGPSGGAEQIINSNAAAATLTVSGAVSPSRPFGGVLGDTNLQNLVLVKDGPNTLWLNNGYNSYTGGTTVKNGLLLLSPTDLAKDGSQSSVTGYGDVTVSGGTLQGTAVIQGNLNVGAGGTVRPGTVNPLVAALAKLGVEQAVPSQPGTLTVLGNTTFSAGANMQFDFGPASNSLLNVYSLSLPTAGNVTIGLSNPGLVTGTYPVITYSGLSGNTSALAIGTQSSGGALTWSGITAALSNPGTAINVTFANSNVWDVNTTASFQGWQTFSNGNGVTFDDTGSGGTVSIASSVAPASLAFNNTAKSYTLAGGSIVGSPSLTVSGSGAVVLNNANAYPGAITVSSGTLSAQSGIASASASVASGATLNLSAPGAVVASSLAVANSGNFNVIGGSHTMNTVGDVVNYTTAGTTSVSGGTLVANTVVQDTLNATAGGEIVLTAPQSQSQTGYSSVNNLNMNGGKLDLQATGIYVTNAGTAAVFNAVKNAEGTINGAGIPAWNGTSGITSSTQAAANPSTYGVGYVPNYQGSGAILIQTALLGDASLTGEVTSADRALVSGPYSNYNKVGVGWSGGDFLYAGYVSNADRAAEVRNQKAGTVFPSSVEIGGTGTAEVDYNPNTGVLSLVIAGAP